MEPRALLVANLLEAFKQLNAYLTLGLIAAISALALEQRATRSAASKTASSGDADAAEITLLGGFPALPRSTAQLLLVGISFVAGVMASYSAEAAEHIVSLIRGSPVLGAACTFASVATAPYLVPILASALPVVCAGIVMYRKARMLHEPGIWLMLLVFAAPYVVVAMILARLDCRAS